MCTSICIEYKQVLTAIYIREYAQQLPDGTGDTETEPIILSENCHT
jgi:hypothetical protein